MIFFLLFLNFYEIDAAPAYESYDNEYISYEEYKADVARGYFDGVWSEEWREWRPNPGGRLDNNIQTDPSRGR